MTEKNQAVQVENAELIVRDTDKSETTADMVANYNNAVYSPEERQLAVAFTETENAFFCSIHDDGSRESKVKIYNAMNNTFGKFADIQDPIVVTDIVAHNIELLDDETGEISPATRIVLVDENGNGYDCVAQGIFSSIQKIIGLVGPAPWNPGLKVRPKMVRTRKGYKTMTIELLP